MKRSTRLTLATLTMATMAMLTACADDEPAEFDPPTPTETQATEPGGTASDEEREEKAAAGADEDATSNPAITTPVGPDDAIETITYEVTTVVGDSATVTVGLHSLEVDGEVMRLDLSFTPELEGDGTLRAFEMIGNTSSDYYVRPVLNDRTNLKQYTVLEDEEGNRWATDTGLGSPGVSSGQTLRYWGYFAAPEDDIDTISVGVGLVEFENVTIER